MRLLSRAAIALAAILFVAPALHAQVAVNVALGAALPMGDAADGYEMGYNVSAGVGIKPPLAPLGVRVEGMFNSFGAKGTSNVSTRVMGVTANGTFTLVPQAYLIFGVGMYNSKLTNLPAGVTSDASTDFGFNGGVGVNIPLTGFGTYVEARFHHISGDGGNFQFVPLTFGIKF
jgi:hypothetical protein